MPYYPVRYDYMQIPRFRRGIGDETFFADPEAFGVPKHSFNDVQVTIEFLPNIHEIVICLSFRLKVLRELWKN